MMKHRIRRGLQILLSPDEGRASRQVTAISSGHRRAHRTSHGEKVPSLGKGETRLLLRGGGVVHLGRVDGDNAHFLSASFGKFT